MGPQFPNLPYYGLLSHVFDDIVGGFDFPVIGLDGVRKTMLKLSRPFNPLEARTWHTITEIADQSENEAQQITLKRLHDLFVSLVNSKGKKAKSAVLLALRSRIGFSPIAVETQFGKIGAVRQRTDISEIDVENTLAIPSKKGILIFYYNKRLWTIERQGEQTSDYYNLTLQMRLLLEELGFYHNQVTIHDNVRLIVPSLPQNAKVKPAHGFSVEMLDQETWLPIAVHPKKVIPNKPGRRLVLNPKIPQEIIPAVLRNLQLVAHTLKRAGIVMDNWNVKINRFTGEVSFDTEDRAHQLLDEEFLTTALSVSEAFRHISDEIIDKPAFYYFPNLVALFYGFEFNDWGTVASEQKLNYFIQLLGNNTGHEMTDRENLVKEATNEFKRFFRLVFKNEPAEGEEVLPYDELDENIDLVEEIISYYLDKLEGRGLPIFLSRALPHILDRYGPDLWTQQASRQIDKAMETADDDISSYWSDDFEGQFWNGEVVKLNIKLKQGGGNTSGNGPLAPVVPINGGPVSPPQSPPPNQSQGINEGEMVNSSLTLRGTPTNIPPINARSLGSDIMRVDSSRRPWYHVSRPNALPNIIRGGLGAFRYGSLRIPPVYNNRMPLRGGI